MRCVAAVGAPSQRDCVYIFALRAEVVLLGLAEHMMFEYVWICNMFG